MWKELLFTGFYTGYIPLAPGTAGAFLAALIFVLEYVFFGNFSPFINFIIILLTFYPSIRLCDAGEVFFNEKDPSKVVLDEIIGYLISVLSFPFSWSTAILAFIIFRAIDILKPFPVRRFEKLKGGLGIVLDDFAAGVYTNLIIRIIIFLCSILGLNIF